MLNLAMTVVGRNHHAHPLGSPENFATKLTRRVGGGGGAGAPRFADQST
jgi:hypothetical protein